MASDRSKTCILVTCIIVLFIIIILIIDSFAYLDYYEYGFLRQRSTGRVNLSRIYEHGRYYFGPDYT